MFLVDSTLAFAGCSTSLFSVQGFSCNIVVLFCIAHAIHDNYGSGRHAVGPLQGYPHSLLAALTSAGAFFRIAKHNKLFNVI